MFFLLFSGSVSINTVYFVISLSDALLSVTDCCYLTDFDSSLLMINHTVTPLPRSLTGMDIGDIMVSGLEFRLSCTVIA